MTTYTIALHRCTKTIKYKIYKYIIHVYRYNYTTHVHKHHYTIYTYIY